MNAFELPVAVTVVATTLAYWAYSRWRARVVFRKMSGKGKKAKKKVLKRLSKEERLVYEQHGLRMIKMFAVAFSIGSCWSLVTGEIHVEVALMVLNWSGDVTMSTHPFVFWILWLIFLSIPAALWVFFFHERMALEQRTTRAAMRGAVSSSERA
ncbi:MAG: hypothetical protein KJP16_08745 [Gammaproteobacteria bacterium]|nr:hypothetical protein [Gammaproteobacteria bacterium]NNL50892.1 hypothetical protein [Woeseiaceae bacterium]